MRPEGHCVGSPVRGRFRIAGGGQDGRTGTGSERRERGVDR